MKKFILLLCFALTLTTGYSQTIVLMNSLAATATGNYSSAVAAGRRSGGLHIYTNAAFNGSTSTVAFEKRGDNQCGWATVMADDNTTPITFTLSAGEHNYTVDIKNKSASEYRVVYTKGNATLGTVRAVINLD